MPLSTGLRTLTFQVTDPQIGDSLAFFVFLTSDAAGQNIVGSAGAVTPAQINQGSPLTFSPTVNVASAGTYYGWAVLERNGSVYAVYPQGQLVISTPYNFTIDATIFSGVSTDTTQNPYNWTVNEKGFYCSAQMNKSDWASFEANAGLSVDTRAYDIVYLMCLMLEGSGLPEYQIAGVDMGTYYQFNGQVAQYDDNGNLIGITGLPPNFGLTVLQIGTYRTAIRFVERRLYANSYTQIWPTPAMIQSGAGIVQVGNAYYQDTGVTTKCTG